MSEYKICSSMAELDALCIEEAQKSSCVKRKVGAILVFRSNLGYYQVLAKGYNYNPDGSACELPSGETKWSVVHAEMCCLYNFAETHKSFDNGFVPTILGAYPTKEVVEKCFPSVEGKVQMIVTYKPCANCQTALDNLGIEAIVSNGFMKFDSQKPRMALVPASLGISCARALTYGAKKYKPNNWRLINNIEQYISALTRHLDAWKEGEENDPESGLCHLDHAAANLSFLIELKNLPKINLDK